MRGKFLNLGNELSKASNLRFLANLLVSAPETIAAREKLDPLFDELALAQEREAQKHADHCRAAQDLENAKEQARQALEAKVNEDPAVVEAAKKLEPFRRLGALVE
jgi:hypothetical protein